MFAEVAEGLTAYRYSEDKTLSYLRRKVERLAERETFSRFLGLSRLLAKDGLVDLTDSREEKKGAAGTQVEEKAGADDEKKEKARQGALHLSHPPPHPSPFALNHLSIKRVTDWLIPQKPRFALSTKKRDSTTLYQPSNPTCPQRSSPPSPAPSPPLLPSLPSHSTAPT